MLRLLLRLRRVLPPPLHRRLLDAWWERYWRNEERKEERRLGRPAESAIRGSERAVLIEAIAEQYPFCSLLEAGFGYGQNFDILARLFPNVRFAGIDADSERVRSAQEYLREEGISCVSLAVGRVEDMSDFPDGCADIVICSALLLYVPAESIGQAAFEMLRTANRRIIVLEQDVPGEVPEAWRGTRVPKDTGRSSYWLRDYRALFQQFVPTERIKRISVSRPRWEIEQWKQYAAVFSIDVRKGIGARKGKGE